MGSITKVPHTDKVTGKAGFKYRAYVRRVVNGKSVGASKVCLTEKEAKTWLRNNESDAAVTARVARGLGVTFSDVAETFAAAPPQEGTKYWAPAHLDFWIQEFGQMRIGDVTHGQINAVMAKLQVKEAVRHSPDGLKGTGHTLTVGTINRYLATLSSLFNFAVSRGILESHPMKGGKVRKLKEDSGRKRILTDAEVDALMAAAAESSWPMMPLFLRMLLATAARKSEVLRLRWKDVDLDRPIAMLYKTKNGSPRALPIVSDVRAALIEASKVKPINSDFVFFDPHNPTRPKNIDTIYRFVRKRAGLWQDREDPKEWVVLHTTRHTATTHLIRSGANVAQVANVTGHKTLSMLNRYTHLAAEEALQLAEQVLAKKPA